jgi:hypothetical protein
MRCTALLAAATLGIDFVSSISGYAASAQDRLAGDGGVSDFYVWSDRLPNQPGILLRHEALGPPHMLDNAATGERVLYTSTDGMNDVTRIAVSGAVYLPKGTPPAGGWPIMAWAHGTVGIADVCAPSWRPRSKRDQAYLNAWLGHGFAVVASDYQGLGTPGLHPYLLYKPEGYSILDNVRAALRLHPSELGNKVLAIGQSQGAGAALGASLLAPSYAPDVNLVGTVATGIVAEVASPGDAPQVSLPATYTDADYVDAAYSMLYFLGTGRAIDPSIDPAEFVSEKGAPLLEAALHGCLRDLFDLAQASGMTGANIFKKDIGFLDELERKYAAFPTGRFAKPVFIGTGLADKTAGTAGQYNFTSALCHAGTSAEWHYYPGRTHSGALAASLADSIPFAQKLLAGAPAPGNCSDLRPPGPIQPPDPSAPDNN